MPSELPINSDLMKALLERRLTQQPAGLTSPAVMRAMNAVGKHVGVKEMAGVRVSDFPMKDPEAFSNIHARTPIDVRAISEDKVDPESIQINPGVSAAYPQGSIESLLIHELQHVKQNRGSMGDGLKQLQRLQQLSMPYEERPDEKTAFGAQGNYDDFKKNDGTLTTQQGGMVNYLAGLFSR